MRALQVAAGDERLLVVVQDGWPNLVVYGWAMMRVYLGVVIITVGAVAAVGQRHGRRAVRGLVVVVVAPVLEVVLLLRDVVVAEEVARGGRDVAVLAVLLARRELGVHHHAGDVLGLLVRRRQGRSGVHQKRAHDH